MKKPDIKLLQRGKQYYLSIASVLVVAAACFVLSSVIGYHVVALLLLLVVSLLAITFDIGPVLTTAALSALIWDYFFIPPRFNFHVNTAEDTLVLVMYFVIAFINGVLTYKIRQVEKALHQKEARANSVTLYNTVLNSLSHELRTPIASIIGAADNLQGNSHLNNEDKASLVSEISKAGLRLNQQVENLLNISRLESGHIQPKGDWCDIEELIHEIVKRVEEGNAQRKIGISINSNMPFCFIDRGLLEQVLYNLLNNAAIHTGVKCTIDVTASCHADLLEVLIEDSGTGFSKKEMQDVFNKFAPAKQKSTAGSGLGLSIVKGFTEALNGTVEVARGKAGGALFTIAIPVKTMYLKMEQ